MPYIAAYMYLQNSDEICLYVQNAVKNGYNDGVKRGLRWTLMVNGMYIC